MTSASSVRDTSHLSSVLCISRILCSIYSFAQLIHAFSPANIPLCKAIVSICNSASFTNCPSFNANPLVYLICHLQAQILSCPCHGIWQIKVSDDTHLPIFSLYIYIILLKTYVAHSFKRLPSNDAVQNSSFLMYPYVGGGNSAVAPF